MSVGLQAQERQSEIVSAVFFFSSPWKGEVGCAAAGWGSTREFLAETRSKQHTMTPSLPSPLQGEGFRLERNVSEPLLSIRGVKTYYGNVVALKGVDVDVNEGEIVALIGANGAGKSTLMMTVFGNPRARDGEIRFDGRDITALPTHEIAKLRIAQSPEGRRIFSRMTVMENLQIGATVTDAANIEEDVERVFALFPRLRERRKQRGGTLSGGEQQMLAIGRALMSRPRLILLDEPSLGLAPLLVQQIFAAIRALNERDNLTVFLVEQNAFHALKLAHRGYVMVNGEITLQGPGRDLLRRPEIRAAYLEGGKR